MQTQIEVPLGKQVSINHGLNGLKASKVSILDPFILKPVSASLKDQSHPKLALVAKLQGNFYEFYGKKITIDQPLNLPVGVGIKIFPGTVIDLIDGASIRLNGPVIALGKPDDPITITSSDGSGTGLLVTNAGKQCRYSTT